MDNRNSGTTAVEGSTGSEAFTDGQTAEKKYSMETYPVEKYSMQYCLEQIERIGNQTEYINQAISELRRMDGDSSNDQKAMALGNIVEWREQTNQQMLRFYGKMYDDLKTPAVVDNTPQKAKLQEQLLNIMDKTLENGDFSSSDIMDMFNGAFDAIRHIAD